MRRVVKTIQEHYIAWLQLRREQLSAEAESLHDYLMTANEANWQIPERVAKIRGKVARISLKLSWAESYSK